MNGNILIMCGIICKSDNYDSIKNILFDDEASDILIKKITITL